MKALISTMQPQTLVEWIYSELRTRSALLEFMRPGHLLSSLVALQKLFFIAMSVGSLTLITVECRIFWTLSIQWNVAQLKRIHGKDFVTPDFLNDLFFLITFYYFINSRNQNFHFHPSSHFPPAPLPPANS